MSYAIVHYPQINTKRINQIRQKYDPQVDLIPPHITLVFPIKEIINSDNLMLHLQNVLSRWQPFPIHLQGLQQSWDKYLFLMVKEGNSDIIKLHNELYTDILAEYCRKDIPFVPHLTLGVFTKSTDIYWQALEETPRLDLDYHCIVDKVHLINIHDDKMQIVSSQDYVLQS